MRSARLLGAVAGGAARRARLVLVLAALLGIGGAVLATRLEPSAATSSFVSSSSAPYRATQTFYRQFGEEPVAVLVHGDVQQLVLGPDLGRLLGLEGCLSGRVPRSALANEGGVNGPCGRLAKLGTVKVVFGPGTFLNEAASQIQQKLTGLNKSAAASGRQAEKAVERAARARGLSDAEVSQLGREARQVTAAGYRSQLVSLALAYGLTSPPSLQNKEFISDVVFDSSKAAGTPKQRFAYLFPSRHSALISARLRPGLSQKDRDHTIEAIRDAVRMPQWKLTTAGASYAVTGEPVIVSDLAKSISSAIVLLLIAVIVVMAGTLGLVFSGRPRLLPLALALLAAALTFGALSAAGASLTVASIAVLPVLVGLAVDYAIQFQSRVGESLEAARTEPAAASSPPGPVGSSRRAAIELAARAGGPTIATAAAASAAAMLVLLLSPVPMVRGFGVLLAAGVAVALLCAFTAGAAALALLPRSRPGTARSEPPAAVAGLASAWRGAGELVRDNALTRAVSRFALGPALRHPGRVLGIGLALAALGWGLDTQTRVETDITKLVPQDFSSLRALNTLERESGVGGEVAVLVSGRDLASPATIEWMTAYQRRVLSAFGYSASRGCGSARLCPAFSLPDLFGTQSVPGQKAPKLTSSAVSGLLSAIPPYFSQDVISSDRRFATLSFGIRLMGLDAQQHLIERMGASLHPPAGVHAQLVGLPVLAARSGSAVADPWRRLETLLAGLAAVALVLLIAFRGNKRRALVPLAPIALATGWSALVLFVLRIPLNPMSVTLGALVIAISTEFSVLLSERHRQEMQAGHDVIEALRRSYSRTGAAVAASGATAIFGFGVLALSDIRMLRDFGLVTLVDLTVSLLGVLTALPAVLVLAERGGVRALRPSRPGRPKIRGRLRPAGRRARSGHGRA